MLQQGPLTSHHRHHFLPHPPPGHRYPSLVHYLYSVLFLISLCSPLYVVDVVGLTNHYSSALTFQVDPRSEQCFYEEFQPNQQFSMEFEVVRGGLLDIRIRVQDPNGNTILEKMAFFNRADDSLNEAEGRVAFTATIRGRYSICFDNSMSRWTPKIVSFFILNAAESATSSQRYQQLTADSAQLADLGPIVDSIIKIADSVEIIEQQQHHGRIREQNHRDSIETTNSRIQWYSLIESFLLIGITIAQLQYIRNWFKETHKYGRV